MYLSIFNSFYWTTVHCRPWSRPSSGQRAVHEAACHESCCYLLVPSTPASPNPAACRQLSHYSTSPCTDHIEIGLLQRSAGRLTTDLYNRTTSASTKRCGTSDLRVGSKGARHSMSSPTALVACPLAHPVQTVLYYAFSFQRKLPGVVIRHRSDSECQ